MSLSIEEINSLINVVSKNKVKQIDIVGEHNGPNSNVQKLYDLVANGTVTSDSDAESHFFNGNPYQSVYLNRLKRELKRRLLNTLFFIDVNQPNFTDIQKAYYQCHRQSSAVKILIGRGARMAAISLAEKTVKKSMKFDFTDITIDLARNLRMHYGNIEGNKKKFLKYRNIVKKYTQIYQAELLAEDYYCDIAINYTVSQSKKPELLESAREYYEELREILKKHNSYRLNLHAYLLFFFRYDIENDHKKTLEVCKEAITYFEAKPHIASKTVIFNFLIKELSCYIITKKYEEGEKVAKRCVELQPKGSINRLLALDYYVILQFHSNMFERAFELYLEAINEFNIDNQLKASFEHWKIHGAFLHYLIAIGKIKKNIGHEESFKLNKFLNEVPSQSKDKQGVNVSIIIIQILFLLQKGKYDEIIDRTEALKTYTHRYLRRDHTFRSNCFIKMLLCLPAASFHKAAVIRKAKKYLDLLNSVPLEEANQSPEVEIIPYGTLWEFVLESLDHKFH